MNRFEVRFRADSIRFLDYPYAPASVYPSASLSADAIRDVDPGAAPPELRLPSGETLFVRGGQQHELREFCARNAVPLVARPDLWDALLQPFVDTEFTPDLEASTRELLGHFGLDADEVAAIRARVGPAMIAYNFGTVLWDWVHLGLMDLLEALSGRFAGGRRLSPEAFAETYWWAMALADRSAGTAEPITRG